MNEFDDYLAECRALVLEEIRDIIPKDPRYGPVLYELMLDYPLREGKGFRPALCIATCRALGGHLEATLRTAAVLELYHNAFLIHDDFEDGSLMRRGDNTLHRKYGAPIAINVGDAMLALSLSPLLDNMELLGLGKALRILRVVADMARESAEGQALELFWIREGRWDLSDEDYFHLVHKKTCWYTFLAPILIGGIIKGVADDKMKTLEAFAVELGVAFQIVDDVLNLEVGDGAYGKEHLGDLWEGKHTLILMHAMRTANPSDTTRAQEILQKSRADKTDEEVRELHAIVERTQSVDYARNVAYSRASNAREILSNTTDWLQPSVHRAFLEQIVDRVVQRNR
mgnify:CR=1 FL=1